jgi:hypothetical protein
MGRGFVWWGRGRRRTLGRRREVGEAEPGGDVHNLEIQWAVAIWTTWAWGGNAGVDWASLGMRVILLYLRVGDK